MVIFVDVGNGVVFVLLWIRIVVVEEISYQFLLRILSVGETFIATLRL